MIDVSMRCVLIQTAHDSTLFVDPNTFSIFHLSNRFVESLKGRALLFSPSDQSRCGILFAEGLSQHVRVVEVLRDVAGSGMSLVDPISRRLLTALPPDPASGIGTVSSDRRLVMEWETFHAPLVDIRPPPVVEQGLIGLFELLVALGEDVLSECGIRAVGRLRTPASMGVAETLAAWAGNLRMQEHGAPELEDARRAVSESGWSEPGTEGDMIWRNAQKDLRHWVGSRSRTPHGSMNIGPDLDVLDQGPSRLWHLASPGQRSNAIHRSTITPQRDTCLVAAARNEGAYLIEWIAHHRAIGFDHIFLYTNSNDDGSDMLLAALAEQGDITWVENHSGHECRPQIKAYNHALSILPDILDFRWTFMLDLDELLYVSPSLGGLKGYLRSQEIRTVDAIALNWLMFGPSNQIAWESGPLAMRFCQNIGTDMHIKSGFKTRRFDSSSAHFPVSRHDNKRLFRNEFGEIYRHQGSEKAFSAEPSSDYAFIAHYFFKSAEEFLWKNARNRGDQPISGDEINWSMMSESWVKVYLEKFYAHSPSDLRIQSYEARACSERAYLLRSSAVQQAYSAVLAKTIERMARIRAEFLAYSEQAGSDYITQFASLLKDRSA